MTKYKGFLALPLVFGITAILMFSGFGAASTAHAADAEHYRYEYSPSGIVLPMIHLQTGQGYKVEVFAGEDAAYASPFAVIDGVRFYPQALGDYRLRYTVNDNGTESYRYAALAVEDTTAPVFSLTLATVYQIGDEINIKPSIVDNTSHLAVVKYDIMLDGKRYEKEPVNGVLAVTQNGTYKLRVTVTDGGGNAHYELYTFAVEGEMPADKTPTGLIVGLSVGGAAVLAGGVAAFVLVRKNMRKKAGVSND